jgi:organic radical activating enzyme
MAKLIEIKRKDNVLTVFWMLTDFCNYRCNYCPSRLNSGDFKSGRKPGYPTDDEIRVFLDKLVNVHGKGKILKVIISGGEPTLHPMYEEIVNTLHPHGIVETITNGTRSIDWWQQLNHLPDKVTISLHAGWSKIDKVNELGEFLLDKNVYVALNLMADPNNWALVQEMHQQLTPRLQKNFVNAKIITDHKGGINDGEIDTYQFDQLEFIKNNAFLTSQPERRFSNVKFSSVLVYDNGTTAEISNVFNIVNNNQHNFKEWECSAGSKGIAVSFDGNAYVGICHVHLLGKITTFELYNKPILCPRQWCDDTIDITVPKKKPTWHQDQ